MVRDALAALGTIDGETLPAGATGAAELLALVAGQDVAPGDDGVFRIVRGVAKDRVISTVSKPRIVELLTTGRVDLATAGADGT